MEEKNQQGNSPFKTVAAVTSKQNQNKERVSNDRSENGSPQHASEIDVLQSMIDISADRLVGLRTQCSTSAELTRREIRTLEGKLIKLFARELILKQKLRHNQSVDNFKHLPSLEQWLQVVGLCQLSVQCICSKVKTLETLQEKPLCKLKNILCNCSHLNEEHRRLTTALKNLKRYTDILLKDENEVENQGVEDLHWDSWDWQYGPISEGMVAQEVYCNGGTSYLEQLGNNTKFCSLPPTPPLISPPLTPIHKSKDQSLHKSTGSIAESCKQFRKYSDTCGKDANGLPIIHESQLFNVTSNSDLSSASDTDTPHHVRRGRLSTVIGTEQFAASPLRSPPFHSGNSKLDSIPSSFSSGCESPENVAVSMPRSPRTPIMAHDIAHRFTKHFSINKPCDYCCKPIIMNTGLKCKECRYRCHKDCESKVPPSCGLPAEFVDEFKKRITPEKVFTGSATPPMDSSPGSSRSATSGGNHAGVGGFLFHIERRGPADWGHSGGHRSNSHSWTPSSPALFATKHNIPNQAPATASAILTQQQQFDFSADSIGNKDLDPLSSTAASIPTCEISRADSDKSVNREDSNDSQNWEGESTEKGWPRQYSVSMKEWEIPWDELKMGEKLGQGHFGTVYTGYWHGDVAVKVLNMDYLGDEKMLESFKSEVSTFRKTRHDNLVLFMGACMKPPRLAIVTSMLHGITLYKYIHLRMAKFSMSKTVIIAQQISQGMGYLHAKGIVHKDLRSKNVFLEKERVIITDFGLFSVTKLCFKNRAQDGLNIPPGWLFYLSPEIMRKLSVHIRPEDEHLPFSKESDIYAFGTVWYELLIGDWPFMTHETEVIIWQVGVGMKPPLANLEASRDVKDILMQCWAFDASDRPDFATLLRTLDRLPKKRLARSPSHPVNLSRSAESMF